jgi:hypothetical protein
VADAVEWLILKDLKDVLAGISTGGGYNHTVRNSYGWVVPDQLERPATSVSGGKVTYVDRANDLSHKRLPFTVQAEIEAVRDLDEATDPDRLGWQLVADIVKALLIDVRRDDNATDTSILTTAVVPDWPMEPIVTVEVTGAVDFRTAREDPTVPR